MTPHLNAHSLIEISVSGLENETAQTVIKLFDRWGQGGAVVEHIAGQDARSNVKTYLLTDDENSLRQIEIGLEILNRARQTPALEDSVPTDQLPKPRMRFLTEADWAEAWKANYGVFRIGRRLVVKPTWHDYDSQPNDLIIALDPGMAFGSGLHPTTRLCLESLENYVCPQATVLDVGTGSGILAIAAARLGASHVLALDTDPLAVRVARENVALNEVGPVVRVEEGSVQIATDRSPVGNRKSQIPNLDSPGWDLVVANILAETIIELAPALASSLVPEGVLVTSGIIGDRAKAVLTSLSENGLRLIERRDAGEWLALIAQ